MRVKAAVARAYGMPLAIEALDLVEPGPGEILVRLVACGVSRFDAEAIDGTIGMPLPFVPGSEGAGIVERVGADVAEIAPGDAVFVDYAACGTCKSCVGGHPRACADFAAQNFAGRPAGEGAPFRNADGEVNGFVFGQSAFATHLVCRADGVVKLPIEAPLEIVAALGGEVLTGAAAITEAFRLRPGDTLAITGAGPAGLSACMIAKDRGAQAIVIADPSAHGRDLATRCGATVAVHADEELETVVKSLTGDGASFALETTGRETARRACLESLRPGGMLGVTQPAWQTPAARDRAETTVVLSVDRYVLPRALVPDLIDLHRDGRFPIARLIEFFPLARVNDALEAMRDGSVVKPVLRFSIGTFGDLDRARSGGGVDEAPEPKENEPAPTDRDPAPTAPVKP